MQIQITLQVSVSILSGYIPRSGVAGSCGNAVFNFLRKIPTVFYSSFCINCNFLRILRSNTIYLESWTFQVLFNLIPALEHNHWCPVLHTWHQMEPQSSLPEPWKVPLAGLLFMFRPYLGMWCFGLLGCFPVWGQVTQTYLLPCDASVGLWLSRQGWGAICGLDNCSDGRLMVLSRKCICWHSRS